MPTEDYTAVNPLIDSSPERQINNAASVIETMRDLQAYYSDPNIEPSPDSYEGVQLILETVVHALNNAAERMGASQ